MIRNLEAYINKKNADAAFYDFFDTILTEDVEKKYKAGNYDYIGEMLQSHSADKLIDVLKNKVSTIIKAETFYKKDVDVIELTFTTVQEAKKFFIRCAPSKKEGDDAYYMFFERYDELKDALNFFNYFATYTENNLVYLEPKFTEEMSVEEYNDCNGIFFHLTEKKSLQSILENGFRIRNKKSDNTSARYYPKRIYMFAPKDNLKNLDKQLKEFADYLIGDQEIKNDTVLVKINMNNFKNKRIFKDLTMENGRCYFVYTNIPSYCISIYKDYKNLKV